MAKTASALTSGNTVVLKPSIQTPLATLYFARICTKYLPAGVFNVITGTGGEAGDMLCRHPLVKHITFTGSTEAGRSVMMAGAERLVSTTLELGGKNPQIVFPDADDDQVAEGVIKAARYTVCGQSCFSGTRVYVHESIYQSFLEKMVKRTNQYNIGDPLDESTDIGPLVGKEQFEKVLSYIANGINQPGVRVMTGGMPPAKGPLTKGYYIKPTILADVQQDWRVAREEIFGPVTCVMPWRDEDDVVRKANDSIYGLSGFVWTYNIGKALRTAHAIESGWIQVSQFTGLAPGQTYGGYKMSGVGKEWSLKSMVDTMTQEKVVTVGLKV